MEISHRETGNNDSESNEPLIPGLPNEVAMLCLVHLPYPYQSLARSISSSWNKAISHPSFLLYKKSLSLSRPYLFVLASHKSTATMQWQALDPSSNRWFLLPPMPSPKPSSPNSLSCASLPRHGKLIVMGGLRSDIHNTPMDSTFIYRTSTNQWSRSSPMPTSLSHFTAAEINGKIITVNPGIQVSIYDPETESWESGAKLGPSIGRYDSAVMAGKLYLTEGWRWPFTAAPRGAVYDGERDRWEGMREGMREGWTGLSVVVGGRLMVISEYGDCEVKVYEEGSDGWEYVKGDRFPREKLERPFTVRGEGGSIYVVGAKMNVGIGRVEVQFHGEGGKDVVKVKWDVLEAPHVFQHFMPSHCHLLYA